MKFLAVAIVAVFGLVGSVNGQELGSPMGAGLQEINIHFGTEDSGNEWGEHHMVCRVKGTVRIPRGQHSIRDTQFRVLTLDRAFYTFNGTPVKVFEGGRHIQGTGMDNNGASPFPVGGTNFGFKDRQGERRFMLPNLPAGTLVDLDSEFHYSIGVNWLDLNLQDFPIGYENREPVFMFRNIVVNFVRDN